MYKVWKLILTILFVAIMIFVVLHIFGPIVGMVVHYALSAMNIALPESAERPVFALVTAAVVVAVVFVYSMIDQLIECVKR